MVDRIKEKYPRKRDTQLFNEFREPDYVKKIYCKKCIIAYAFMTITNSIYFFISLYGYHKYSDNDILRNSDDFNNILNKINTIVENICYQNTTNYLCN